MLRAQEQVWCGAARARDWEQPEKRGAQSEREDEDGLDEDEEGARHGVCARAAAHPVEQTLAHRLGEQHQQRK
eukprot:4692457-Pleurochrysis_carterae.AAC.1